MGGNPLQDVLSQPTQSPVQQPQAPQVQPVQSQAGPIKSFLQNFVYGAGQGLVAKAGLETDAQKQQRMFNQSQTAEQNRRLAQTSDALSAYRQTQEDKLKEQSNAISQGAEMVTAPDTDVFRSLGLVGSQMPRSQMDTLNKVGLQNQGKYDSKVIDRDIATLKYGDGSKPGPLNTVIKDINGRSMLLRRGTGDVLKDLG